MQATDTREVVSVLDVDPDLKATVPRDELGLARRHLVAEAFRISAGSWDGSAGGFGGVGLLVVEGLLTRELEIGAAVSLELLGTGDVVRPWDVDPDPELSPLSASVTWAIREPVRFAVLDRRFIAAFARWPELGNELIRRVLRRSRWLAVRLAISSMQAVTDRITLLLWHIAGNWGRVTPDGTLVPVSLTHELIAELIGARRPSVTTAIGELREAGVIERRPEGWLLKGPTPSPIG